MRAEIEVAHSRIAPHIECTPCPQSEVISEHVAADIFLKLENRQRTGSFKLRGVLNKILSLSEREKSRTLVTASTGNHGAAFAHAVDQFSLDGRLFMPRTAAQIKLDAVRDSTVTLELVGDDCVEAETHGHAFADDNDCVWISPYNDRLVVNGQGTAAVELLQQLDSIDVVLVPVGGGGLISGMGGYLKSVDPRIQVIGCQPKNSCVMYESIKAGRILEIESLPTLSDATAGGIETGSITFEMCRNFVDDFILLEEDEIIEAICFMYRCENMAVEGSAALPVAAVLKERSRFAGQRVALVVSGSKIDEKTLRRIGCLDSTG